MQYDITLEVGMPENALGAGPMDFYERVGIQLEKMGISCTVSSDDRKVQFDLTLEAETDEEAHDSGLIALVTATLVTGVKSQLLLKGRTFDANCQN